jgi:DNA polymerase lambda
MSKVIELFDSVWGIGVETATRFYQKGFRTLEDLRKNEHLLNVWQKVGLKYHEEFKIRIPRQDVDDIIKMVKAKVSALTNPQHIYDLVCCGSYRRYFNLKTFLYYLEGKKAVEISIF